MESACIARTIHTTGVPSSCGLHMDGTSNSRPGLCTTIDTFRNLNAASAPSRSWLPQGLQPAACGARAGAGLPTPRADFGTRQTQVANAPNLQGDTAADVRKAMGAISRSVAHVPGKITGGLISHVAEGWSCTTSLAVPADVFTEYGVHEYLLYLSE